MGERPAILSVRVDPDGSVKAGVDDGSIVVSREEFSYNVDLTRVAQLISHQYEAIVSGDMKEAEQTGSVLAQILLPAKLRERFPGDGEPLLLSTNEHSIPWELLWDKTFLGIRYAMGRQLITETSARNAGSGNAAAQFKTCLIITNPTGDLPEAQGEALRLMEYFRARGMSCTLLAGEQVSSAELLVRFGAGDFDIIHYSGHIDMGPEGAYLRLARDDRFYLKEVVQLENFGQPFIFLNGCGGGPAWGNSTEIVKPLIFAGSGPILCATMPITDAGSRSFAESIISAVLDGKPYGRATMDARRRFYYDPFGGTDWMCFAYYGNPLDQMLPTEGDTYNDRQEYGQEDEREGEQSVWDQARERAQNTGSGSISIPEISEPLEAVLGRADALTGDIYVISTSHLFAALLLQDDREIQRAFQSVDASMEVVLLAIFELFQVPDSMPKLPPPPRERYSPNGLRALDMAVAATAGERSAMPKDLFAALLSAPCVLTEILEALSVDYQAMLRELSD